MLSLVVINENENSFRAKLFNAYQQGLNGSDHLVVKNLQKREEEIFKIIHTLIYECGQHDKKHEDQKRLLARERRLGKHATVEMSYLFIGKDSAVNQGMQEFKALAKKIEKTPYKYWLEFSTGPWIF